MDVLRLRDLPDITAITALLARYQLNLVLLEDGSEIPGSYWHEAEAGIIGLNVLVRMDTPLHSVLHESCHTICMDEQRRAILHTDAGGDDSEEDAVCYLQILLADEMVAFGQARALHDMDAWGYSFRLGSAARWFAEDAEDARAWLIQHGLLSSDNEIIYRLRQ